MIEARSLWKSYGSIRALRGVSFAIETGRVAGLLGPNGAGKSSTLRILTGFRPPDAGSAAVQGIDLAEHPRRARRAIGYLPESAPLYDEMSVRGFLHYRSRLFGVGFRARRAAVAQAIGKAQLDRVAHRRIGKLSKGFRQRVGLAAALVHEPPVLILDEPTNGLDPSQVRELRNLIRDLASDTGKSGARTVLISSHVLSEIERVCDDVVMLVSGQVRAVGSPADLIARAARVVGAPYTLELRTGQIGGPSPAAAVQETLERLGKVAGVTGIDWTPAAGDPAWSRLTVRVAPDAGDLRESLAHAAQPAPIRELAREPVGLEELFVHLADEAECADADTGPNAGADGGAP
ncbi:MAG: ABC transporter ATP-binding protein [Planctomycetota bacterium]